MFEVENLLNEWQCDLNATEQSLPAIANAAENQELQTAIQFHRRYLIVLDRLLSVLVQCIKNLENN